MKESESIKDFFSRVTEIVNQIRAYGDQIEEKKIVEKILRSLPPKFDHAAAAIEESEDLSILTMYDLCTHEKRMKRSSGQSLEQAFQSKVNLGQKIQQKRRNFQRHDQFQRSQNNQPRGHGRDRGRGRNTQLQRTSSQGQNCIICKKSNHTSDECYLRCKRCRIPNHSDRDCWHKKNESSEANFSKETDEEQVFLTCLDAESRKVQIWYLDSSCSSHMTNDRELFVKID